MSVIVWDGKTLAADKQSTAGTTISTVTKIRRIHNCLVGAAGDTDFCEALFHWFQTQEDADWPKSQEGEKFVEFLVVKPGGKISKILQTKVEVVFEDSFMAIGCGRNLAIGAMAMGATARQAVEIASMYDAYCGRGIDTLTFEDDKGGEENGEGEGQGQEGQGHAYEGDAKGQQEGL